MTDIRKSTWRQKIYSCLFDIHTRSGRKMEFFWIFMAIASVVLVFIESGDPQSLRLLVERENIYLKLEVFFTVIFSLEYFLRLFSTPKEKTYAFSFLGIIDLLTTLPLYIFLFFPALAWEYVVVIRLLRVLRVLRIFKMLRYIGSASLLWDSIISVRKKLLVFFTFVMILLCLFGGVMYVIEGPEHGFTSLPISVYWAVVTMTTVGYGDITPHTPAGRILASMLILIGYSIIAIPTGVLTAHMTEVLQRQRHVRRCEYCHKSGHDDEAQFCKHCGHPLSAHSHSDR
ncbi:ion transporter [Hafnia alvei]|nr:ion transporter [Hafnia alvei]QQE44801.1 ion transporter [Hafnia alvei]